MLYPSEYLTYGTGASPAIVTKADGSHEYHITDHLGSPRVVLDDAKNVVMRKDYEPYGEIRAVTGEAPRQGYIGKEMDRESDLAMHGVRAYSASEGRFLSIDPLLEKYRGWSPYQYSLNEPTLLSDGNGFKVDVKDLSQAGAKDEKDYVGYLKMDLESITGLLLTVQDGQLQYIRDENGPVVNGGSETARDILIGLIDSEDILEVRKARIFSHGDGGGIWLNPNEISRRIDGTVGLNPKTLGWGMTFFHEFKHTPIGGGFTHREGIAYDDLDLPDIIGNQIRCELGDDWGQRLWYGSKAMEDGNRYQPYTIEARDALNSNRIPSSGFIRIGGK